MPFIMISRKDNGLDLCYTPKACTGYKQLKKVQCHYHLTRSSVSENSFSLPTIKYHTILHYGKNQ